ncbi:tripartite tricarboxylate transporter TctB family protein [Pseudogulbenkiania sp. MAI-1]|uniref:tripartite tricarboxylate transporter TctB family protein n=1 Tax=Pseudogulbenkiania sp. MAI-1 TaxID=990370 RepID=UPI0004A4295F|nr:tripartite tricarboxylate transporter TctB family protein [Pseudogulbenkiania sp. MAI-1]
MSSVIKGPKDFWTGVLYVLVGGAGVYIAQDYGTGEAARMGPGYFPTVLGGLLLLFGLVAIGRSFFRAGEAIGHIPWKPISLVIGATVLFGLLLRPVGLVVAMLALILLSAAASSQFRFEWRASVAMIALIAACSLVFVKGLGVPMPLLGSWFGA